MFYKKQKTGDKSYYKKMLSSLGGLSRLFSDNIDPYLDSRIAENLFCKSFEAENLGRADCSADARQGKTGIGIKTFLDKNGNTLQKIAEFNKKHELFKNLEPKKKVIEISKLRNERIASTKRIFALDDIVYHCITRKPGKILVYEVPMDSICIEKISVKKASKNTILFTDGKNEYSFNSAKNTLYKRFLTKDVEFHEPVKILDDPFEAIGKMFAGARKSIEFATITKEEHIFLPLYSMKGENKHVYEKSGLNQWNAKGRDGGRKKRNAGEVYIPIPAWIHKIYPDFFPSRETPFSLKLPNGSTLSAKMCQQNRKALMSKKNKELGNWLLRDVMDLKENERATYKKLEAMGLDSVVIYKTGGNEYSINFTKIGAFEKFEDEFKPSRTKSK